MEPSSTIRHPPAATRRSMWPTSSGRNFRRLSNSRAIEAEPKANPKNPGMLAFVSGRSGPEQIFRMNTDGADVGQLSEGTGEASNPSWNPDGLHLLFAWTRGYAQGAFNIFLMDTATRQFDQLTANAGRNENPTWAPDGRHLLLFVYAQRIFADLEHAGGRHADSTAHFGRQKLFAGVGQGQFTVKMEELIGMWMGGMSKGTKIALLGGVVMFTVLAGGCAKKHPVPPPPPPLGTSNIRGTGSGKPAATFTAEPSSVDRGQSALLRWSVSDSNYVSIDTFGAVQPNGERRVTPYETTTYHLTADGPGGRFTAEATVTVNPGNPSVPPPSTGNTNPMSNLSLTDRVGSAGAGRVLRLRRIQHPGRFALDSDARRGSDQGHSAGFPVGVFDPRGALR